MPDKIRLQLTRKYRGEKYKALKVICAIFLTDNLQYWVCECVRKDNSYGIDLFLTDKTYSMEEITTEQWLSSLKESSVK